MQVYRTPEECFDVWVDNPFKPNCVEEGETNAPVMETHHQEIGDTMLQRSADE